MLSKGEIENKINLKDKTKYTIEKSKKIIENHKEDNCDCSIETSLAYDMQYVEKYIDQLEKENYNLKVISKAEIEQREQLETDKQKLIEKLEEHANRKIPLAEDGDYVQGYRDLSRDLLKILKGEKE